jgi:hypothetical protein
MVASLRITVDQTRESPDRLLRPSITMHSIHTNINNLFEGLQDDAQLYNAVPLTAEVALNTVRSQGTFEVG